MEVTTLHEQYRNHAGQWQRCRDAFAGQDAVKARGQSSQVISKEKHNYLGTEYLPALEDQQEAQYQKYKKRALWFGATKRTVRALVGSIIRKPMQLAGMEGNKWEEHLRDVTLSGVSLPMLTQRVIREVMLVGRYGILADLATNGADTPRLVGYNAESMTNWDTENIQGKTALSLLVLAELYTVPNADRFKRERKQQFRVLYLDGVDGPPVVQVEVWRRKIEDGKETDTWVITEGPTPLERLGQPLREIPFTFFNPTTLEPEVEESPVLELVDANLDHYRLDADLKNRLHLYGVPTPYFAGFEFGPTDDEPDNDRTDKVPLGSDYALVAENPQAKADFLDLGDTGEDNGLTAEKGADERRMAALGARLLEQPVTQAEAAMAIQFRHAGEHATLAGVATTLEEGLTRTMRFYALWALMPPDNVAIALNKDYFGGRMQPQMLTALVASHQSGEIDDETLYFNLEQGELTMPGDTFDDYRRRVGVSSARSLDQIELDNEEDEDA